MEQVHLRPDVLARPIPDEVPGAYPVAVGLVGPFTSFFANRPIPPPPGAAPDDPAREAEALTRVLDGAPSRMIVVSSADWQSRPERHRVELDLPARGERATQLTVYARDGGSPLVHETNSVPCGGAHATLVPHTPRCQSPSLA